MPYAFQQMRLEAESLYALINTWAETQLEVRPDAAVIVGYGYNEAISEAFTLLVFDWEATIHLDISDLDIPLGAYRLIRSQTTYLLYACSKEDSYPIPDRPVVVEVVSVPEL